MDLLGRGWARYRRWTGGDAARASGLATLTDLQFLNGGADAMLTVALASKLFFAVPTGQARGQVALYLLTTVAPFALVAPVVGPLLDRVGRLRRVSVGATLVARAVLAWLLAGHATGLTLYPLALGALVASKAFGVARSAIVPRVQPEGANLVSVNARLQLATTIGTSLLGGLAAGLSAAFGFRLLLRLAALAYLATVLVVRLLPARVDGPRRRGEHPAPPGLRRGARRLGARRLGARRLGARRLGARRLGRLPQALGFVLPLRGLVGFLTLFLAFYLRNTGHGTLGLGALAVAAGVGNAAGLLIGAAGSRRRPEVLITAAQVVAAVGTVAAAVFFSLVTAVALALVATLASVTAKLALDAIIQRDVPDDVRASAFGRSETGLQLAWVAGGALGLIPFTGRQGFVAAAAATVLLVGLGIRGRPGLRRRPGRPDDAHPDNAGGDRPAGAQQPRTVGSRP